MSICEPAGLTPEQREYLRRTENDADVLLEAHLEDARREVESARLRLSLLEIEKALVSACGVREIPMGPRP